METIKTEDITEIRIGINAYKQIINGEKLPWSIFAGI